MFEVQALPAADLLIALVDLGPSEIRRSIPEIHLVLAGAAERARHNTDERIPVLDRSDHDGLPPATRISAPDQDGRILAPPVADRSTPVEDAVIRRRDSDLVMSPIRGVGKEPLNRRKPI